MGTLFKTSVLLYTRTLTLLFLWTMRRKNVMVSYHWTYGRESTITSGWADVFPSPQCFSNPLKHKWTITCLLSDFFFPQCWICCGAIFRCKGASALPRLSFLSMKSLRLIKMPHLCENSSGIAFWGVCLGWSLSVCLSNSNLNCRNCEPVSLIKSSGLLQREVWKSEVPDQELCSL